MVWLGMILFVRKALHINVDRFEGNANGCFRTMTSEAVLYQALRLDIEK